MEQLLRGRYLILPNLAAGDGCRTVGDQINDLATQLFSSTPKGASAVREALAGALNFNSKVESKDLCLVVRAALRPVSSSASEKKANNPATVAPGHREIRQRRNFDKFASEVTRLIRSKSAVPLLSDPDRLLCHELGKRDAS